MKISSITAIVFSALALFSGSVAPQEIITKGADISAPANTGVLFEKADDNQAELINSGTYFFSAQSGIALEDMSSGTTKLIDGGINADFNSALTPIGFPFRYDGANFSTFGVNSDGFVKLGGTTFTVFNNSIASVSNAPKIMPYWNWPICVGSTGKVHYKTSGAPGSRKLIVEWKDMNVAPTANCTGTPTATFQLWLFEGSGVVQFVYGNGMVAALGSSSGYSVGIQSGAAANFASITTANNSVSYSSANDNNLGAITAGTSYLFTPAVPAAPTGGSVTSITQVSLQLNWTDAPDETGYLIQRSTDNVNFSVVGEINPNSTSFSDSGLEPGTQYFYQVNSIGYGAYSSGLAISATTNPAGNISSVAAGGLWSSPSTWASGTVPLAGDNVTIASGSTVIIDTAAVAGYVTVGSIGSLAESEKGAVEGGSPATLRFGENGAFSLAVAHNVTIGSNDAFTTGSGNANQHVLNVKGDLTNNGTLDFSTDNNQAGATIIFTGATNNTFGGTGPTTDVMSILIGKGSTSANILELTVSNFTVRGSATDTAASGYLILNQGTFKISGTFSGNHRTFPTANYDVPVTAGLWLNNPNYTITAQNSSASFSGYLRISAGTYNVGTALNQTLSIKQGSSTLVEGGNLNTAAALLGNSTGQLPLSYTQTGGTVTTCTVGQTFITEGCFYPTALVGASATYSITGGKIVIQNPSQTPGSADINLNISNPNVIVQFGNSLTAPGAFFEMRAVLPNVVLDTTTGGHALFTIGAQIRTMNIGTGGTFEVGNSPVTVTGETFVNNGNVNVNGDINSKLIFTGPNTVYSGSGTTGAIRQLVIRCNSFTINSTNSIRVRSLIVATGDVINANRFIIGNNSATASEIGFGDIATTTIAGALDSAPVFDLGTGGLSVYYNSPAARVMGPEISPSRTLNTLDLYSSSGTVTMTGGDVAVITRLGLSSGEIVTGTNKLLYYGPTDNGSSFDCPGQGFVNGTLVRGMQSTGTYFFPVGVGAQSCVRVGVSALGVTPSFLSIKPVDTTLPGLLPATSVSKYWTIEETGDITASVALKYLNADVNGNENNYQLWRSTGGPPVLVPGSVRDAGQNTVSFGGTDFNGNWGIGEQLDPGPVSVSGRVTTSTGNPIRNAVVTISGGNLQAPITVVTGSLGTYLINGLQAGETYNVSASAKRYRFPVGGQNVTPFGNVANVDFAANPQDEF